MICPRFVARELTAPADGGVPGMVEQGVPHALCPGGRGANDEGQEVLMQAISGQLTWLEAEDILGWRPRTLRRWRLRYRQRGYDGLWDRPRQHPSPRCAPVAEVARITRLY